MEYITLNELFNAVISIPESRSTDTVTYTITKVSDGTSFATGSAIFIAGMSWKVPFTPLVKDTYVVEVLDVTLDVKYSNTFMARDAVTNAGVPVVAATVATDLASMLTAVETAIANFISNGAAQSYTIGGRTFQRVDLDKLIAWRDKLKNEIDSRAGGAVNYAVFS